MRAPHAPLLIYVHALATPIVGPCDQPRLTGKEAARHFGLDEDGQPWLLVFLMGPGPRFDEVPTHWMRWRDDEIPFVIPDRPPEAA